jgi:hypothetical protein
MTASCDHDKTRPVSYARLQQAQPFELSPRQQRASEIAADVCTSCRKPIVHFSYAPTQFESNLGRPALTQDQYDALFD